MSKQKVYTGSSKVLYTSEQEFAIIMAFTDNIRLRNGEIVNISGKGALNNAISSFVMSQLEMIGIENHLIEKINMREQLVQFVDVIPIQVVISALACGRYVKELGMEEGYVFDKPIIEYRIKNNELKYPVVNEHQIKNFDIVSGYELKALKKNSIRIYDFLSGLFSGMGIRLVECKLEFGRVYNGEDFMIMLADEVSADTCMLWDMNTNAKLGISALDNESEADILNAYKILQEKFKKLQNF